MKNLIIVLAIVVIIIGAALYVISNKPAQQASMDMQNMPSHAMPAAEDVVCPVTGDIVDPVTAKLKTVYKGKTYYFCCEGCPEKFKENPEKYAK